MAGIASVPFPNIWGGGAMSGVGAVVAPALGNPAPVDIPAPPSTSRDETSAPVKGRGCAW